MGKITQKELLREGFLDAIRAAGRAVSKGAVKATGAAVGGALGAAKNIAKDIIKGDVSANPFTSAGRGLVSGAKTGVSVATKAQEAITGKEEAMLRKELETNYKNVFQPISLNIHRGQTDPTNPNIMIVPFTARKLGTPTTSTIEAEKDNKLKGRFLSPATQFFKNPKGSVEGSFFGYIKKTNNKKEPYSITVRDISGNIIQSTTKTKIPGVTAPVTAADQVTTTKPKFYESLRDWKIKNIGPNAKNVGVTYNQLKEFLKTLDIQDADRVLKKAGAVDRGAQIISNNIIAGIEATLKGRGVVSENSQINLIKQLKLINDSYNKTYELSKH